MKTQGRKGTLCWECGKKLYGKYGTEMVVDGHKRTLHKRCAQLIKSGHRELVDDNTSADAGDGNG